MRPHRPAPVTLSLRAYLKAYRDRLVRQDEWIRSEIVRVSETLRQTEALELDLDADSRLTFRERQVLDLALQGLDAKEIGGILYCSQRTAKFHLSSLYTKFGVRDRAGLSARFLRVAS